jgi:nicotinate-nucleotide pyrophosphorylase (carboxylating)
MAATEMNREDLVRHFVDAALAEDVGEGDWTTLWTVPEDSRSEAVVVAKEALTVAGTEVALAVFRTLDSTADVEIVMADGSRAEVEDMILRIEGSARAILTGERTALNFLGRLSGVATLTRRYVEAVAGTGAGILDTRKTTPGWRVLEKEAVRAGGGENHRIGLYDMVMVKDNHIVAAGGIAAAVAGVRESNAQGLAVEVEVNTLEELDELLPLGVDRILLDNMTPGVLTEAVARVRGLLGERAPELEASGNVTLETIRAVADSGVDFISVGALTHSAPSADFSLRMLR